MTSFTTLLKFLNLISNTPSPPSESLISIIAIASHHDPLVWLRNNKPDISLMEHCDNSSENDN